MKSPQAHAAAAVLVSLLCAAPAKAETSTCDVTFAHEEKAFKDLVWDSGWVPKKEDIQVRFKASMTGGINVEMPASAALTHGATSHGLTYTGKTDKGLFKMGLDTSFKAYIKIDKKIGSVKIKYDGELPLPGKLKSLNKSIGDQASFTPLALPGAPKRPIKVALKSQKYHIITIDTPLQLDIKVASVKVKVPIHMQVNLNCELKGKSIQTKPATSPLTIYHTAAAQTSYWPADGKLTQKGDAYYFGERELAVELVIYPSIEVKGKADLGFWKDSKTWKVAEFKISTDLVKDKKDWDFKSQPVTFSFTGPDPLSDGAVPVPNEAGVYPDGAVPVPNEAGVYPDGSSAAGDSGGGVDSGEESGYVEGACNCDTSAGGAPSLPLVFLVLGAALMVGCRRR